MKKFTLSLLAAAAIGIGSLGGASAMPFGNVPAALGESLVQDVAVVCERNGRCYNTNRRAASPRYGYGNRHSHRNYGHRNHGNRYGHQRRHNSGVNIGVGPVGVQIR